MKILHIIDTLEMGGAENVLASLSAKQKSQGNEVAVMPLVCTGPTPVRRKIEEAGVEVSPFLETGSVYNPILIVKILRVINNYDIVHVHLFPALYWAAIAKLISISKVPMVYTEHSTNNKRRNNILLHFTDKVIYKKGYKLIIACAEKVLDIYKKAFPEIKHVCYINNGVDTKKYWEAEPYSKKELVGVGDDSFIVTMVARFMWMKRQDTIVEAISKLPDNIHAVFVGGEKDDEGLKRVQQIAIEKGAGDRVHFLYVRTDVPRILKTSDVVIMASDYEGLSLSSIEGMAAGKPFVATNVNGLREVISGAGVLFDNKNADELAQIISRLAEDKEYYNEVKNRCLKRATDYDINKTVVEYMSAYQKVLKQ